QVIHEPPPENIGSRPVDRIISDLPEDISGRYAGDQNIHDGPQSQPVEIPAQPISEVRHSREVTGTAAGKKWVFPAILIIAALTLLAFLLLGSDIKWPWLFGEGQYNNLTAALVNPNPNYEYTLSNEKFGVVFEGEKKLIDQMSEEDVHLAIDVGDLPTGDHTGIPVLVELPDEISPGEVNPSHVIVTVILKGAEKEFTDIPITMINKPKGNYRITLSVDKCTVNVNAGVDVIDSINPDMV
ncbi:unnamed protein product, partial [marine sediment metagenome]